MITVRLKGGLGNQLFQYAAARALAMKHQTNVAFDLSFLVNRANTPSTSREYELGSLGIGPSQSPFLEKLAFGLVDIPGKGFLKKIVRRLLAGKVYHEKTLGYDPELYRQTGPITYLNGYLTTEKYFIEIESLLRRELRFRDAVDSPLVRIMQNTTSVSLHIRRGDYLSNPAHRNYHGVCSLDYYQQAVAYLEDRLGSLTVFVFSDDLAWARENLSVNHSLYFVDENVGKDSYLDMYYMSLCRHHIIANSTFSWWGAWLNPSPDKIVIAPQPWFLDAVAQSQAGDIVPESWVRVGS